MSEYMKKRTDGQETRNWSQGITSYYKRFIILTFVKCLKNKGLRRINKRISLPEHSGRFFLFLKQKR